MSASRVPTELSDELARRLAQLSPERRALLERQLGISPSADTGHQIPRRPADGGPAPLSFSQELLWRLDQALPDVVAYHVPRLLRLSGPLDECALRRALDGLAERHEVFRTRFVETANGLRQVVDEPRSVPLAVVDLGSLPDAAARDEAGRVVAEQARVRFDLARDLLLRAVLIRLSPTEHLFLLLSHHIVSDESSRDVLFRELGHLYNASVAGREAVLPALPIQYSDYAAWQRDAIEGGALVHELAYWREQLRGLPALDLPTDLPRGATPSFIGERRRYLIDRATLDALKRLSHEHDATLFMTLMAAYQVLFSRYTGQDDFAIGTPITTRRQFELEGLIGYFPNVLVLRAPLAGDPGFVELLRRVRESCLDAYEHHGVPLDKLALELRDGREVGHSPLFQTWFVLLAPNTSVIQLDGLTVEPQAIDFHTAKFDIALVAAERPDGLEVTIEYRTALFRQDTIDRLFDHYRSIVEAIVTDPVQRVSRIPLLSSSERQRVVEEFNVTAVDYPAGETLVDLIEAQAARTPNAVAVEDETGTLTHRQLHERAELLAHWLRAHGVAPGRLVGLCLERSLEMVVALVAVLKAGAAYVPLDPEYPVERLAFMLDDADVAVLLTQARLVAGLPQHRAQQLLLDAEWVQVEARAAATASHAGLRSKADDAAYMIYTSGSTGQPKGALNSNRGIVNRLRWMQDEYQLTSSDTVLQKTPFSFDVSVWELFWPLMTDARLVMARPGGHRDAGYLADTIGGHSITVLHFVPSMLRAFLEEPGATSRCRTVRDVICSGEALSLDLTRRFFHQLPSARLHNLYGPTEAAVDVSYWRCDPDESRPSVPIGRPVSNTQLYVLDAYREPTPIGVPGELFIAGVQVGLGYHRRPELTADRFVRDPFAAGSGARMYATGDRARWLADGTLEYLGRLDHQVKLRGHRIELGEVESVLAQHPGVVAAAAIVREDAPGDKRLVAYVVVTGAAEITPAVLQEHVRHSLPDIMVPSAVVELERLPLNANGKLDRAALPAPDATSLATDAAAYIAPRTPLEADIAGAWAAVLRLDRVGVNDDFFDLGGHSLAAMRVLARLADRLPASITLGAMLSAGTVAALAALVANAADPAAGSRIVARGVDGPAPLSHAQQLIWLFEQMTPGSATYNVPMVRRVKGELNLEALRRALDRVVARHEILRTTFEELDGEAMQIVHAPAAVSLSILDLRDASNREAEGFLVLQREAAKPFDLAAGPILRTVAVRLAADDVLLLLVTHHIAFDGASLGVLMRDLSAFYGQETGDAVVLPDKLPIQFADYAVWERDTPRDRQIEASLDYWRHQLDGAPGSVDLPTDRPRNAAPSGPGARHVTNFPAELATGLNELAREHDTTLFMLLLAGFQSLLYRYSGQDELVVGSPIAGRVRPETQDLIGYFANTLALRARFGDDPTFVDHLAQVRRTCLDAYERQDVPYEKIVLDLRPRRAAGDAALFSVMFVLQDGESAVLCLGDAQVTPAPVDVGAAKFDLSFSMAETPSGLRLAVEYRTDLFDAATIERMTRHFQTFLERIVEVPRTAVSCIPLLHQSERQQVLEDWNATTVAYPENETLLDQLEAQAARSPEATAVEDDTTTLSYAELHARADSLGHWLRTQGVGPGSLVGVSLDRSVDLLVALVGVLKAGAAYVPLDPEYPAERLAFMLEDAGAPVLLTEERLVESLPPHAGGTLVLDRDWDKVLGAPSAVDPKRAGPDDPAYMIYTSGSTGQPKGALNSNRGIANRLRWMQAEYRLTPADIVLQKTPASFDVSVWEFFWPLISGARLVMAAPGGHRDPGYLAEAIERHRVTVLHFVPSMLAAFLDHASLRGHCASVRDVICSGEALRSDLARRMLRELPHVRLHNLYGPTEAAIDVSFRECRSTESRAVVPIGRPVANTRLYVLDRHREPVGIGVPGELYIGGLQVGMGYHRRAELTADRFTPDPFAADGKARLYRTGDRARWLADGNLEFLGRMDFQVKLRGQRIELGEVEAALLRCEGIDEAVAIVCEHGTGDERLVCYFVASPGRAPDSDLLLEELRRGLPTSMVPSALVRLDAFPLTPSGKLDRRALPAAANIVVETHLTNTLAQSAVEVVISSIWSDVLRRESVGVDQNFFAIGGHSLLATQVVARVTRLLRTRSTLRVFFEHPTVRRFAGALAAASAVPGQVEAIANAVLRLRDMSPSERDHLRAMGAVAISARTAAIGDA